MASAAIATPVSQSDSVVADLCPDLAADLTCVHARMQEAVAVHGRDVYEPLAWFLERPGKMLRAALTFLFCDGLGGERDAAVEHATIVELIHAFTLIHDDVEDRASIRRGRPCLHRRVGEAAAINLGDALYTIAWHRIAHLDGPLADRLAALRCYATSLEHVVYGQALDLRGARTASFDALEADYVHTVAGKTGALLGLACEIGALCAGCRDGAAARRFGRALGIAFQVRDDILDIIGDRELLGKDPLRDLKDGKLNLPLLFALARAIPRCGRELKHILQAAERGPSDWRRVATIMGECGALAYAQQVAERFASVAHTALASLPSMSNSLILYRLIRLAVERSE
jgi:geranylgeranyl pyrophosphate synthase